MNAVKERVGAASFEATDSRNAANASGSTPGPATLVAMASSWAEGASVAVFHGFNVLDQPQVGQVPSLPGEIVVARSVVAMRREMIGASVVLVYEGGDVRRPIILGVLLPEVNARPMEAPPVRHGREFAAHADDERLVITAEREVVLKCGEASITLTRAGKVLIEGRFVMSRSSGCNKVKGAVVDIN